jgi:Family of unknown function (DUF6481)
MAPGPPDPSGALCSPAVSALLLPGNETLRNNHKTEFADRRSTAAEANTARLEAYRAAREAAAPTLLAKQAERQAIAAARDERRAERERIKAEEQARLQAEIDAREAELAAIAQAEAAAREAAIRERSLSVTEYEAFRLAKRKNR